MAIEQDILNNMVDKDNENHYTYKKNHTANMKMKQNTLLLYKFYC